jgi:hypothetical protein
LNVALSYIASFSSSQHCNHSQNNTMSATPGSSIPGAAVSLCLLLFSLLAPTTTVATSQPVSGEETSNGSCIAAERDALLAFKAGITSNPSRQLRSWRGQDCCQWHSVNCSTRTGQVVKLDLRNDFFVHDLLGEDHAVHWLRGKICSSLAVLRYLKHLDLSGNYLGANMPVPEFVVSLKSLAYLDLSNMNFSGGVPPKLGNLTKLVYLESSTFTVISYMDMHTDLCMRMRTHTRIHWMFHGCQSLRSLEHLDMSGVHLRVSADWVCTINTLQNLRVLYLSNCGLDSSAPSLLHNNKPYGS